MNRRQLLTTSALGLAGLALSRFPAAFAAEGDKKRVGLIGTGWYGKCDLMRLIQVAPVDVVSICDVDKRMVEDAAELISTRQLSKKKPRIYSDYREMLKEKNLDIALIGTPDHWHALQTIEAMKAGCDVYCQKPIGVDVVECQAMLAAARKYKKVVQIGTQRRSTPHLVEARDRFIKEGKLGKIAQVEICCYWHMRSKETLQSAPDSAPPDYLDFEMWTGPAPMMPFNKMIHPRGWRAFMEYGNGIVGDMCVHMLDMVRWMMGLGWPKSVASTGGILVDKVGRANISDTQTAQFEYDGLQIIWTHRTWGETPDPKYPWSATFYGDKGTLKASVFGYDFIPRDKGAEAVHKDVGLELDQFPEDKTEKDLEKHCAPAIRAHMKDFLANIETRGKPVADIEEGCISSVSCILANLSMQLGRSLTWDAANGVIANDPEANKLLARPYRNPWVHPTVKDI